MPTYIVKVSEETAELFNQINPHTVKLNPMLLGAVIFKVDTTRGKLHAMYYRYLNIKQKNRLIDSLDETQLNKINQIRLSNLLEE